MMKKDERQRLRERRELPQHRSARASAAERDRCGECFSRVTSARELMANQSRAARLPHQRKGAPPYALDTLWVPTVGTRQDQHDAAITFLASRACGGTDVVVNDAPFSDPDGATLRVSQWRQITSYTGTRNSKGSFSEEIEMYLLKGSFGRAHSG